MDSLWPEDLTKDLPKNTPAKLLREQAEILTETTKGVIRGEVTSGAMVPPMLQHSLRMYVPALQYRYFLCAVSHRADQLYPVTVGTSLVSQKTDKTCATEVQFREALKEQLGSERTKMAIKSLLAQAIDAVPRPRPQPPRVIAPMKCSHCGNVTVFEIQTPPAGGSKSFEFRCAYCNELATTEGGGAEVVDLKDYDEQTLKRVIL